MNVYIFKTSVKKTDFKFLKPVLDKLFSNVKWNFDFADCDKILRIESEDNISSAICDNLNKMGYLCLELE
jgi:hypothetical protein